MRVLVSDTSVLIDLERGNFLDAIFALPYEFAVPDVLYRRIVVPPGRSPRDAACAGSHQ